MRILNLCMFANGNGNSEMDVSDSGVFTVLELTSGHYGAHCGSMDSL